MARTKAEIAVFVSGWSQRQLAKVYGCDAGFVSKCLKGKQHTPLQLDALICDATDADDLFDGGWARE